jgi:hypothetical protein
VDLSHASRIEQLGLSGVGADSGVDYPIESELSLVCIGFTELHTDLRSGVHDAWRMWELQPYAWHPDAVLVCCQVELDDFAPALEELSGALKVESGRQAGAQPSSDLLAQVRTWVRPVAIGQTTEPVRFRADLPHALVPSRYVDGAMKAFLECPTTEDIKGVEAANDELGMPALVWRWRMFDDHGECFEEGDDSRPRFMPTIQRSTAGGRWPSPLTTRADVDFRIADTERLVGKAAWQNIERSRYAEAIHPGDKHWLDVVKEVVQSEGIGHLNRLFREQVLGAGAKLVIDDLGRVESVELAPGRRVPVRFPLSLRDFRRALLEAQESLL